MKKDNWYEIYDKNGEFIERDYVLDSAVEYALENDGYIIKQVRFSLTKTIYPGHEEGILRKTLAWDRLWEK